MGPEATGLGPLRGVRPGRRNLGKPLRGPRADAGASPCSGSSCHTSRHSFPTCSGEGGAKQGDRYGSSHRRQRSWKAVSQGNQGDSLSHLFFLSQPCRLPGCTSCRWHPPVPGRPGAGSREEVPLSLRQGLVEQVSPKSGLFREGPRALAHKPRLPGTIACFHFLKELSHAATLTHEDPVGQVLLHPPRRRWPLRVYD